MEWAVFVLALVVIGDLLVDWRWLNFHETRLNRIESKLDKLIAMQDWNEMADEAERKDGEDDT